MRPFVNRSHEKAEKFRVQGVTVQVGNEENAWGLLEKNSTGSTGDAGCCQCMKFAIRQTSVPHTPQELSKQVLCMIRSVILSYICCRFSKGASVSATLDISNAGSPGKKITKIFLNSVPNINIIMF